MLFATVVVIQTSRLLVRTIPVTLQLLELTLVALQTRVLAGYSVEMVHAWLLVLSAQAYVSQTILATELLETNAEMFRPWVVHSTAHAKRRVMWELS